MTDARGNEERRTGRLLTRLRSGRFPVRAKLVAVLLLPVTLLMVLAALQVASVRQEAREARAEARLAAAVTGPGSFLNRVIQERNHTAAYLLGAEDLISSVEPGQYLQTRELVDAARGEFRDFIEGEDDLVRDVYAGALEAMTLLDGVRAEVDGSDVPRDFQNVGAVQDLFERFAEVTGPLFDANRQVSLTVTDPTLQRGTAIVDQSLRQSDTIALLTYQLVVAALAGDADGINSPDEYVTVATLLRDLREGEQAIRLNGEGRYAELAGALFESEHIRVFPDLVEEALYTGAPDVGGLFASAGDEDAFGYDKLREAAEGRIEEAVENMDADARRAQTYFMIVGLVVLAVLAVVTAAVARSITRPLRSLTRQAMTMADDRLPGAVQAILEAPPGENIRVPKLDPIDVKTRDEVADVAGALNTVQDSALNLAVEQAALRRNIADSFVYLGRRNQSLLGRQLDFITELEQGETDPTVLANLFRLDHLATRMRRNAESLLVLAGVEPPRTWRVPVPLADVVRAALGEVENYQRVAIQGVESAGIIGSAAADLAHLLAELIENALAFSPPHQAVEVRGRHESASPPTATWGRSAGDHNQSGGFTLAVVDAGVGMSPEDIARANRRLAGEESFTIAPSQYLGHYVAGMIARRHGITVRLDGGSGRGITATVTLPASLLAPQTVAGPTAGAPARALPAATFAPSRPTAPAIPPSPSLSPPPVAPAPPSRPQVPGRPQPVASAPAQPFATRGLHPGGRAAQVADTIDTYRVGDAEFQIDFGTGPAAAPVVEPGRAYQDGPRPPTRRGGYGGPGGAEAPAEGGGLGDPDRARQVRDALSSLSTGLAQGRGAAARERSEREGHGDVGGDRDRDGEPR